MAETVGREPVFEERLTGWFASDAKAVAIPAFMAAVVCWALGLGWLALFAALLGAAVAAFFRNPDREIPADPRAVIAPADGRVIEVVPVEMADGSRALRIGIFLSVFDVHINRAPVAGRVLELARSGDEYLAAFNREAPERNVRLAMKLETESGAPVWVVQITGWIARRIVCHVREGEWLGRGIRYGLIRFGSRTDVLLPENCQAQVTAKQRVWGGRSIIATFPGDAS